MLGCALDPSLHMLGRALHSGLYNKVASVHVQHGVVCCSITYIPQYMNLLSINFSLDMQLESCLLL